MEEGGRVEEGGSERAGERGGEWEGESKDRVGEREKRGRVWE